MTSLQALIERAVSRELRTPRDRRTVIVCLFCLKVRSRTLEQAKASGWRVFDGPTPVGVCPNPSCAAEAENLIDPVTRLGRLVKEDT